MRAFFQKVRTQAETLLCSMKSAGKSVQFWMWKNFFRRRRGTRQASHRLSDRQHHALRRRAENISPSSGCETWPARASKLRVAATKESLAPQQRCRQPVVVDDVTTDPRYLMVNPETRSELAIPMIFKGKVIGVLDLESPQLHYFTEEHVQTLTILAANLAVSLENARLYEQGRRDEARMERDLQAAKAHSGRAAAASTHRRLRLDVAARYLSAREVCGDLYDFLRYGPQQLGIALGDVSGKGTAARSMAPFRSASCAAWHRKNFSPPKCCGR